MDRGKPLEEKTKRGAGFREFPKFFQIGPYLRIRKVGVLIRYHPHREDISEGKTIIGSHRPIKDYSSNNYLYENKRINLGSVDKR